MNLWSWLLLRPFVFTISMRADASTAMRLVLFEHINFGGWRHEQELDAEHFPPHAHSEASSLEVNTSDWVELFSKSKHRGSRLCVRFSSGHGNVADLRGLLKQNGYAPPGDWNDEISSVRFHPADWNPQNDLSTGVLLDGQYFP